jgi:perosamine synthetase
MKYSLNLPLITNVENKFSLDVLKSGWISVGGKYNKLFEKKFGQIISKKNNLLVQSGTAALHLALKAININKNHSVITPNFSCSANINCISQCGAKAIVVESENDTLGLDFDLVKKAIIKFKPKALQLVHVYGFPARDTEKIVQFCKKKKVIIIEDASESLGATINGKMVGSFGDISIFSLRSEKMIGVGEGGIISTNSKSYFNSIELIASRNMQFRKKKDPYWKKYISNGEGYNYTMPHILAAIGLAQLKKLNYIVKKKREIGRIYREEMKQFSFAQNILKGLSVINKQSSETTNIDELITSLTQRQIKNAEYITRSLLSNENLIKLSMANPKEIDPYILFGMANSLETTDPLINYVVQPFDVLDNTVANQKLIRLYIGEDIDNHYFKKFSIAFGSRRRNIASKKEL